MSEDSSILNNFIVMIIFLVATIVSGILSGVIYYDMNILEDTLETVNFNIPIQVNSTGQTYANITDFQDILEIVVYPILGLRTALPYLTYFMIFGFIIALAMVAYVSSKNPIFFVVHILFTLVITYFCFILSNMYISLLESPFINSMMIDFQIYNKIMLYLPAITFFTSLVFGIVSFVSIMKPQSNQFGNQQGLNYGGDY